MNLIQLECFRELADSCFVRNDFSTDRQETMQVRGESGFSRHSVIESNDPNAIRLVPDTRPYCHFAHSNMIKFKLESNMRNDSSIMLEERQTSPVVPSPRKRHHSTPLKEEFHEYARSTIIDNCNETNDFIVKTLKLAGSEG
jgi:hypothetical protein